MDLALIHAYVCYRYEKCSSIYGNTHTQYNSDGVLLCKQVARIECRIGGARVEIVCKQMMGKK